MYPDTAAGSAATNAEGLARFDPFATEPLLRLIDPIARDGALAESDGRMPIARIVLFGFAVILPEVICCLIPTAFTGGLITGEGGMLEDAGLFIQFGLLFAWMGLLVFGRRVLGRLVNRLERAGVVGSRLDFCPLTDQRHRLLRMAERLARLTPRGAVVWIVILFVANTFNMMSFLTDNVQTWNTSPTETGTLLYPLGNAREQPNLAGILHFSFLSTVFGYLVLMSVRLYIAFAGLCRAVADHKKVRIIPTHPDGSGGLLPVGRCALILSFFIVMAGLMTTGFTLQAAKNRALRDAVRPPPATRYVRVSTDPDASIHLSDDQRPERRGSRKQADAAPPIVPTPMLDPGLVVLWILYFLLGPLLFFLPLLPLRRVMATAKRDYIKGAETVYAGGGSTNQEALPDNALNLDYLQRQVALASLIAAANKMAVWPFDRRTFYRFFGALVSPVLPILLRRLGGVMAAIQRYLLGG